MSARLGVRLARRELRRRPWRTALVVLMVLLPTTAMTAVVVVMRTAEWTAEQRAAAWYGKADAVGNPLATGVATRADEARLIAALPEHADVLFERQAHDRLQTDDARSYVQITDLPLDAAVVEGRFVALDGRMPRDSNDVVLTDGLASDLGVAVGDEIRSSRLDRTLVVSGTVTPAEHGFLAAYLEGSAEIPRADTWAWIDLPGRSPLQEEALGITAAGWNVWDVANWTDDNKTADRFWTYVVGGLGLIVLSTVIAAAFAIGARRQLRTIGLLSSNGASPAAVTWFLVAQGAVAGLVGSAMGIAVALGGLSLLPARLLSQLAGRVVDGPDVRLLDLVPIAVIGTVVAAGAAWVPARTAARVPALQALAGRRPLPRVPARLPFIGAASLGVGCACFTMAVAGSSDGQGSSLWAVVAIVGGLALLVGVLASAPWLIAALEWWCGRLPEAWRLAGRSLARSRVRSSAVVGAVATVAAALVFGSAIYASNDREDELLPYLRDNQVVIDAWRHTLDDAPVDPRSLAAPVPSGVIHQVLDIIGDADVVHVERLAGHAVIGGDGSWSAGVATPELLDKLDVSDEARRALGDDKAVAIVSDRLDRSTVTLRRSDGVVAEVPLVEVASEHAAAALPTVLLGEPLADRLGLRVEAQAGSDVVVWADQRLTGEQRDRLDLLAGDVQWETWGLQEPDDGTVVVDIRVPGGDQVVSAAMVKAAISLVALLLVLAVLGVGLAMAAKDSEDERQVLTAVGAPPKTLRRVGARRAALLALCAALLAVPTGLLPAAAVVAASTVDDKPFRPDLWAVLFVAVVVPLAAGGGAAVAGRLRDAVRPPRPDSFAFAD